MSTSTPSPRREWVEIGVIARAHGVRGWVRVRLADPDSDVLSQVEEVGLGRTGAGKNEGSSEPERRIGIRGAEADAAGYRLLLDGIDDRDAADALRGMTVLVERSRLPAPADDEIYLSDLVGCTVVDTGGRTLGVVRAVESPAAQDLLVLDPGGVLVPLVDGIVTEVDLEARRVVCDPPEGLLELNLESPAPGRRGR